MSSFRLLAVVALSILVGGCSSGVRDAQEAASAGTPDTLASGPKAVRTLAVGEKAPDVMMRDASGKEVRLADLFDKGPVVLTFYRGGWCPYCTRQLREWQGRMGDLTAAGGTMVAVTLEPPRTVEAMSTKHEIGFMVLSDTSGQAVRRYRVGYTLDTEMQKTYKGYGVDLSKGNANGQWEMPNPVTYVVDRGGLITYVYNNPDYTLRANPDEVISAVKRATGT